MAEPSPSGAPTTSARVAEPSPGCADYRAHPVPRVAEERPRRRVFSWDGYLTRSIEVRFGERSHCVEVLWPASARSGDGKALEVSRRIDDGWLRGIENTLARLPHRHAALVARVVLDDRPTEHGIAPFDRRRTDDARDGHTLWLHERLFTEKNHWAHGNHGDYWSYHTSDDGAAFDDQPATHALFSPILLHELGHLVAYGIVNGVSSNETVPKCARVCGDLGGCKELTQREREEGCISPYCMPFKFETGTENWAEMYRFYFQSRETRALVAGTACERTLERIRGDEPLPEARGLPETGPFERSRWKSCGGAACKPF